MRDSKQTRTFSCDYVQQDYFVTARSVSSLLQADSVEVPSSMYIDTSAIVVTARMLRGSVWNGAVRRHDEVAAVAAAVVCVYFLIRSLYVSVAVGFGAVTPVHPPTAHNKKPNVRLGEQESCFVLTRNRFWWGSFPRR